MCVYMYTYLYMHIYIEREREIMVFGMRRARIPLRVSPDLQHAEHTVHYYCYYYCYYYYYYYYYYCYYYYYYYYYHYYYFQTDAVRMSRAHLRLRAKQVKRPNNATTARHTPGLYHKISVFSDPDPGKSWPLPMNKWIPEQPRPWRKSCERESCYGVCQSALKIRLLPCVGRIECSQERAEGKLFVMLFLFSSGSRCQRARAESEVALAAAGCAQLRVKHRLSPRTLYSHRGADGVAYTGDFPTCPFDAQIHRNN